MTFDIGIRVDPGNAAQTITGVTDKLGKAEVAGKRVGEAASKGLRETSHAAMMATGSVGNLTRALDTVSLKMPNPASGGFGGGIAGSLTGLAGPAAFVTLAKGLADVSDRWNGLENSLSKYATTARSANSLLFEQTKLSQDMRTTMESSTAVFGAVSEATEDLFLTTKDQVDITRTLGQVMTLQGKPVEAATGILEKLEYAMKIGKISGGEFGRMMKQNGDLADIWTAHFGKTEKQLVDMAEKGTLSLDQLVTSMTNGEKVAEKMAKRTKLFADHWREMKDAATKDGGAAWLGLSGVVDHLNESIAINAHVVELTTQAYAKMNASITRVDDAMAALNTKFAHADALLATGAATQRLAEAQKLFGRQIKEVEAGMAAYRNVLDGIKGPQRDYERDLRILDSMLKKHVITTHEYADALGKLKNPSFDFDQHIKNVTDGMKEAQKLAADETRGMTMDFGGSEEVGKLTEGEQDELDRMKAAEDQLKRLNELMTKVSEDGAKKMRDQIEGIASSFIDMAFTAEMTFNKMIESMIRSLAKLAITRGIDALFGGGGPGGSVLGTGASQAFQGLYGGAHAFGGSYRAGGSGGPDSQLTTFRLTPGEHVQFTPPGDTPTSQSAPAAAPQVTIVNVTDESQMRAYMEKHGESFIRNVISRNQPAMRGRTSGR